MARDKEHIDELFKALNKVQPSPKKEVWDSIEENLIKKNKPVGWLALKYAASFTALLLLALSFLFNLTTASTKKSTFKLVTYQDLSKKYLNPSKLEKFQKDNAEINLNTTIVQIVSSDLIHDKIDDQASVGSKLINNNINAHKLSPNFKTITQPKFFKALYYINFINYSQMKELEALNLTDIPLTSTLASAEETINLIDDDLKKDNKASYEEATNDFSRFTLKPGVSAIFSGGNTGANISPQIQEQSQGTTNFSYGLQVAYKVNQKLSLRTGVHQVSTGYQTHNLVMTYQAMPNALNIASTPTDMGMGVSFMDSNIFNEEVGPAARMPFEEASINQELGFIEVPLEASYQLINEKVGLSLIGGMSTLFLNQNSLKAQTQNGNFDIGQATNVNSTSFSANFGFGLDYKFTEKLKINIEPSLRYQINTFDSSATDFKPYFIGIFSGIKFEF